MSSIPEAIRTRAKYLLLDGVACALVGAHLPWSEKATSVMLDMEPAGDCAVFGWDRVSSIYLYEHYKSHMLMLSLETSTPLSSPHKQYVHPRI